MRMRREMRRRMGEMSRRRRGKRRKIRRRRVMRSVISKERGNIN